MKSLFKTLAKVFKNLLLLFLIMVFIFILISFFLVYRAGSKYKLVYGEEITHAAEEYGLDPHLVAGVVKSESDFQADVIAHDGGIGLMQLMPETIDWIGERLGNRPDDKELEDPVKNLEYGTHYLAYLIGKYQSQDLAIVAYNAGFNNVDKWLNEGTISWDYKSLDKIPYEIPRRYVKRVNEAQKIYKVFYPNELPADSRKINSFKLALRNYGKILEYAWKQIF